MKVLLLTTTNSRNAGGLFPIIKSLGLTLLKMKDVEPRVMGFRDEYSEEDVLTYPPLKLDEFHIIGPPGVAFTRDLMANIKKFAPDVIHINGIWLYTSRVNYKYATRNKVPYMISPQGMLDKWILSNRPWKKKLGLALYERKHLENAACIQALSLTEYDSIRDFGLKNPIAIIPNGIFLPEKTKSTQTPSWKANDGRKAMLFLSRLHPKKGLDNLIKAWAQIGEHKKDWKLIIAGESKSQEYYDSLMQMKAAEKLDNDIFFIGNQAGAIKEETFLNADAFILPTFSEGMPMAVLEAWSYGLPSLVTSGCNIPVGFEKNAAIEIEITVESILAGLNKMFTMPQEQVDEIGANALQLVKDSFTWDSVAKQYYDVFYWMQKGGAVPATVRLD